MRSLMSWKKYPLYLLTVVLFLGLALAAQGAPVYSEAPMLTELVAQGLLPPVAERLPVEPLVVEPVEEIGQYGGIWRSAYPNDWLGYTLNGLVYDPILRWSRDFSAVEPNIAQGYELSADGKQLTLYLRPGMKWSDGHPFTADDIMFWYEDMVLNQEVSPVPPAWLQVGGQLAEVRKVDDYTVTMHFAEPYSLVLQHLASAWTGVVFAPKHYLAQFHANYADPAELDRLVKDAGYQFWYQLFAAKNDLSINAERPVVGPWVLASEQGVTRMVAERNPYYWKVDPAGNQLPYIDRIHLETLQSIDMINLKVLAGEVDYQDALVFGDITLLLEGADRGDYRVLLYDNAGASAGYVLYFNQNSTDADLAPLLTDAEFRKALSLGINRELIAELVQMGFGEPRQMHVHKWSPYYVEEYAKAYSEHDPQRANEILDSLGLTQRDSAGYRRLPNGKTLEIILDVNDWSRAAEVAELLKENWAELGIKLAVRTLQSNHWFTSTSAGEHQVALYMGGGGDYPLLSPLWYYPVSMYTYWAPKWGMWYETGGTGGIEPPAEMKELLRLYEAAMVAPSEEEGVRLVKEMFRLHAENLWTIGIISEPPTPIVATNNLRNVPEEQVISGLNNAGFLGPEQMFFKK